MAFEPDNLGLPLDGPAAAARSDSRAHRDCSTTTGATTRLSDRLAPLVVQRGFRSFLDFYYLLKYDERDAAGGVAPRHGRAVGAGNLFLAGDRTDSRPGVPRPAGSARARRADRPIRIWSVPCATGEEPLTIAMVLDEAGWFDRVPIEIHASDASSVAIDKARSGRYRERAFRTLPPALREKYFVQEGGVSMPIPALRARIASWSVVNLMAPDEMAHHARSPVIFCRNAFIYFSPQSVKAVVDAFADLMPVPAYLFLGASESLLNVTDRFMLDDLERAFVYVKR